MKKIQGQTILEYVLLIGIIVVALFSMTVAIKRGTQSLIKVAADEIGDQQNADQSFSKDQGHLDFSKSTTSGVTTKLVRERIGVINTIFNDRQDTRTYSVTNMGFVEENQ